MTVRHSPQYAPLAACSAWQEVGGEPGGEAGGVGGEAGGDAGAGLSQGEERRDHQSSMESRPGGRKHQGMAAPQTEQYQILSSCCQ